jgi:hypothetical protein
MSKIVSEIDKLFDEENDENLVLYDEKNRKTEFEQVAIIPEGEEVYAILKPVGDFTGVEEDEALVFKIQEIDEENCLVIVEDEEVVDRVFEVYYDLLRKEGVDVDGEIQE